MNALGGLMRFCSCSVVSLIHNGNRGAVLGRACRPSEIQQRTEMFNLIIDKGACYGPLKYTALEEGDGGAPVSNISYSGMDGELSINANMFSTRFKLQPPLNYTGTTPLVPQPTQRQPVE